MSGGFSMRTIIFLAILSMSLLFSQNAFSVVDCSHGATTSAKGNNLYLYFPTTLDNTFPEFSPETTSPLAVFDVADLDSGIGTTAQLRNRIFDIVTEDYCEFNVNVFQTTTPPNTTGVSRWNIIGLGTDSSGAFGYAQDVDIGDNDPNDYGRVWAASFDDSYGGAGGALNGANSTLDRWATAIGHTTSHEAGHNYGVGHGDSAPRVDSDEDEQNYHVMATGSTGITGEMRASRNRHFSDTSYEILAHNVGLNIQTVFNWDFINPNDVDAHELEITLLSTADTLTLSTWWNGTRSPWRDPTITKLTGTAGTQEFQGTNYNVFILDFSTDKSWVGGADGVLPGGAEFHIGAGFSESDLVIVYDTKLKDSGGSDLTLHPRMAGFDAGAADLASGDFEMAMFNPDPDAGDMIIRDMNIQYLPRLVDIDAMIVGEKMRDVRGTPIVAHGECNPTRNFELKDSKGFHLAKLSDERFVDIVYDPRDCKQGAVNGPGDMETGEEIYCPDGTALSLFPSTTVYVTATVVDPNARYFDRETGEFVTGPLESKVFYQFAGIVPDFNENGVDDLIDIREGTSVDENGNGVPDEVDLGQDDEPSKQPWWVYLIWAILIIVIAIMYFILIMYFRQRKIG